MNIILYYANWFIYIYIYIYNIINLPVELPIHDGNALLRLYL